jgi:effector-binding domain-containing protein
MKWLFKLVLWLAGVIAFILLIGAFLPGSATVARSIQIKSSAASVFGVLNDLKSYSAWMPWNQKDPAMKTEFGPLTQGKGAYYTWKSDHPQVGNGKMSIIESVPDKLVNTSIEFGGFDRAATAGWAIEEKDGMTSVTWTMHSELSHNPINRWFGLFLDKMVGPDFEKGLASLKQNIENGTLKTQQPIIRLEKQVRPAFQVLTIMDTAQTSGDIGPKLQKAYGEMQQFMKAGQLKMVGIPMAWYYTVNDPFILEAAIVVDKVPTNTTGRIHYRKVPGENAVVAHYFGPYESSSIAYEKINAFVKTNQLKAKGVPYEVYVDDPSTKKSMFDVQTDIVQPLD